MGQSDAVHASAAPDQPVLPVEAVSRERPRQDPAEEDQPDPPAAVDHLEDESEAEEEDEVGRYVLHVLVHQTVGDIAPGLILLIPPHTE